MIVLLPVEVKSHSPHVVVVTYVSIENTAVS